MEIREQDINKFLVLGGALILAILAFLIVRPIFTSVITGLLLAYIFLPIYTRVLRYIPQRETAAGLVTFLIVLIIIIPLWFVAPLIFQELFSSFLSFQSFDIRPLLTSVMPTASPQFIAQMTATFSGFVSKITSASLNSLVNILLNAPTYILHSLVILFVFFFTIRDSAGLSAFVSGLSPFSKSREKLIVKQFKDITDSMVYGQLVIGTIQGVLAGIGFWLFGIPNAFILTVLAIILGIIPAIGPSLLWIPLTIYVAITHPAYVTILFVLYNAILVSLIDNVLRSYIVSKRADISPVIVIVGVVGGMFVFGILGLVLGPLILAYLITLLKAYKDKELSTLFSS